MFMTFYAKLHIKNEPLVKNFRQKAKCKFFCAATIFLFSSRRPKRFPHSLYLYIYTKGLTVNMLTLL
jgi:hypothetical protein